MRLILLLFVLGWSRDAQAWDPEDCTLRGEQAMRIGHAFQSMFEKYVDYADHLIPVAVAICQNRLSIYYTTPVGCTSPGLPGATETKGVNFRIDVVGEEDSSVAGISLGDRYFSYPQAPEKRLSIEGVERHCFFKALSRLDERAISPHPVIVHPEILPQSRCRLGKSDSRLERLRLALYPNLWRIVDVPGILEATEARFCGSYVSLDFGFPPGCIREESLRGLSLLLDTSGGVRFFPRLPPLSSGMQLRRFSKMFSEEEKSCLLTHKSEATLSSSALSHSDELKSLADEDQAVRLGREVARSDDERRARVLELIALGEMKSPQDKLHAALVLQHTGLSVRDGKWVSLSPENYLLAHHLAKAAFEAGIEDARARHLVAQTIDRYLAFTRGFQRYGTNRLIDDQTGEEYLVPIDRSISDEERAKYGVAPLSELLARFPERGERPSAPAGE